MNNKVIPLLLITIIAISSMGAVNAQNPDFGTDHIGWLPVHFWDYSSGSWVSHIYVQIRVNGKELTNSEYPPYWTSGARGNYFRCYNVDKFDYADKRINEVDSFEARFYNKRVGFHTTSWTSYHRFNRGDSLELKTDTYWNWFWGSTDLEVWRNGVHLQTVSS
ncbi:MAG: hypothetical protein LBB45_06000 [Methanobrevibacter sp.]|nr:hypothetical protein [Candidatus Methanovirga basalitermitum]